LANVVASYYYSAALTTEGEIFTWGSGEFGRLGYIDTKK
jgi:alpha-tubulin suppressor-like RCC1 family protein